MKKLSVFLAMIFVLAAASFAFAAYPEKNITCVIQWGAGGGTDSLMRPLCSIAEKELGRCITYWPWLSLALL